MEVFSIDRLQTLLGPHDCTVYKDGEARRLDSRYSRSLYEDTDRMLNDNQEPHENKSSVSPPNSRPPSGETEANADENVDSAEATVVNIPASPEEMSPDSKDCNEHWIGSNHMSFKAAWLDATYRTDWNALLSAAPTPYSWEAYKISDLTMFSIPYDGYRLVPLRSLRNTKCSPVLSEMCTNELGARHSH